MSDLSKTILAKSTQLNADDLAGPITIKITGVKVTDGDQPTAISYEGDNGRPFFPCKSMRRVLVRAWGANSQDYIGRSIALYNEPTVKWGGKEVGGIRISGVSHIERDFAMPLTITRGQKKPFAVKMLQISDGRAEAMNQVQEFGKVRDEAMVAAMSGGEAYLKWWTDQDRNTQAAMVDSGEHDKCKNAAEISDSPPTSNFEEPPE